MNKTCTSEPPPRKLAIDRTSRVWISVDDKKQMSGDSEPSEGVEMDFN